MTLSGFSFVVICLLVGLSESKIRDYYLGALEIDWDYAPGGQNLIDDDQGLADLYLKNAPDLIGRVYKKVLYREFTDDSFSERVPHEAVLGTLGPTVRAEVGDTVYIHFKNVVTTSNVKYTVHPHGFKYDKDSEGALYIDGTSGRNKMDDGVPPGGNHTYKWEVLEVDSPTESDPNCISYTYHSHRHTEKDTNTGLIGIILICKPGTLDDTGGRTDVDEEFPLMFVIFDENFSWLLDHNIKKYTNESLVDREDEVFKESNRMHSINGYLFGHLPNLDMCVGETVSWHLIGMGNEQDLHTAFFHGQMLQVEHHRVDELGLQPAVFNTAQMVANNVGVWLLECSIMKHYKGGMAALFHVNDCNDDWVEPEPPIEGQIKRYYIAAEKATWNYAPSGENLFMGGDLTDPNSPSSKYFVRGPHRIGGEYKKAMYFEYEDDTFTTKVKRTPEEEHLGFLGPIIRAETGDTIFVTFHNFASDTYSIQSRGVFYSKRNEGTYYKDGHLNVKGDRVEPGETFTYEWKVLEGPLENDPQCLTFVYSSGNLPMDAYSGLIGPMLICKKGSLDEFDKQIGIDNEFFLLLSITDENISDFIDENIDTYCSDPDNVDPTDPGFEESNMMHGINGYLYANAPGLEMCKGDKVSWHVIGVGSEKDLHAIYFHGNNVVMKTNHVASANAFPGVMSTLYMTPDSVGQWAIMCRTNKHEEVGMEVKYTVHSCSAKDAPKPVRNIRTYYIAAVEDEWDFSPNDVDPIFGGKLTDPSSRAYKFVGQTNTTIGHKYKKAMFREFTDESFSKEKPRSPEEMHLDLLGPFIKAEVDEQIHVYFKNKASRPYSIHPEGLKYDKASEGAAYVDGVQNKNGSLVEPSGTYKYTWDVPARSGPGPGDPNCIGSPYYSFGKDSFKDMNSGLVGPIVVCRQGILDKKNKRRDIDREIVLLFTISDENKSWYLEDNIRTYCYTPDAVDRNDADFIESNKMHGINGRIYANNQGLVVRVGEVVAWYVIGLGDEVDIHTVHFHGQTTKRFTDSTHRSDVVGVFPGTYLTVEMQPHEPANVKYLLHCHVNDHIGAGMETVYEVKEQNRTITGMKMGVDDQTGAGMDTVYDFKEQNVTVTGGRIVNTRNGNVQRIIRTDHNTVIIAVVVIVVVVIKFIIIFMICWIYLKRRASRVHYVVMQ